MALFTKHQDTNFGVGDVVVVTQKLKEGDKTRQQDFEGMVIAIRGRDEGRSFTVRRIGAQNVGIERIFQLNAPTIVSVKVVKSGTSGVRRSKLYYTRKQSTKDIESIYSRVTSKNLVN